MEQGPIIWSYIDLDVSAWKVVLGQNEIVQGHVVCYRHAARVDLEDSPLGLLIWQWELDLSVDSPWISVTLSIVLFHSLSMVELIRPHWAWPGLMRAGSRVSIRLVAMMTLTSPRESKPSSWLSSSNMVLWISLSPPELESYLSSSSSRQKTPMWRAPPTGSHVNTASYHATVTFKYGNTKQLYSFPDLQSL